MIQNGYILKPSFELLPDFKIYPFTTGDVGFNKNLPVDNSIDDYFDHRFSRQKYIYTLNGREAINIALSHYSLQKEDIVTILTTTGNFYISSCVTQEIEKFCKWSRIIEKGTKLIFVNHEFGIPFEDITELKKYCLPIIEDCAHSFFSQDKQKHTGTVGDFVVYSFPKMFPIQIGGLLVTNLDKNMDIQRLVPEKEKQYIQNVLSHYIKRKEAIIEKRQSNFAYLAAEFSKIGLTNRFEPACGIVPGVFMFSANDLIKNLPDLKKHFYSHGIQCSVFYGEESFFIPVHQTLNLTDLDYFIEVTKSFLNF